MAYVNVFMAGMFLSVGINYAAETRIEWALFWSALTVASIALAIRNHHRRLEEN